LHLRSAIPASPTGWTGLRRQVGVRDRDTEARIAAPGIVRERQHDRTARARLRRPFQQENDCPLTGADAIDLPLERIQGPEPDSGAGAQAVSWWAT